MSIDIDVIDPVQYQLFTLASAAQLNAQANDAWVRYAIPITAFQATSYIAFFNQFGTTAGQGWDLALPSIQVATYSYANYSVMDVQHFPLIMGTGTGWPQTIRSVNVWQANTAGNL